MSIPKKPEALTPLDLVEAFQAQPDLTQIAMLRQIVHQWSMYASGHDQILDGLDFIESEIKLEEAVYLREIASGEAMIARGMA